MAVKFSMPIWIQIKRHLYMTDGLHNIFVCLQLLKHLNNALINFVIEMVQRDTFLLIQTNSCLPCVQVKMKQSEEKLLVKLES